MVSNDRDTVKYIEGIQTELADGQEGTENVLSYELRIRGFIWTWHPVGAKRFFMRLE